MRDYLRVNVLIEDTSPYGFIVVSPQLPGFAGGRQTRSELQRDLPGMLAFAGALPARQVLVHQVVRFESPEGQEYTIRVADDAHRVERLEVADRLQRCLTDPEQRRQLLDAPPPPTGEVSFICVVPQDTVAFLMEQLDPRGDVAVIAAPVADNAVWTTGLAHGDELTLPSRWRPLHEFGFFTDTTVQEMMLAAPAGDASKRALELVL